MRSTLNTSDKQLDVLAEKALKQYARDYAATIILQAKLIAYRENAAQVSMSHVDDAIKSINSKSKAGWRKELLLLFGGSLFGTFIQGFITEAANGNILLITIYVILGLVGLLFSLIGILREP